MMRFKKLLVLCFIFFVDISASQMTTISWRVDYKLQWQDFKGQPHDDTDAVAVTASGITFCYSIKTSNTKIIDFTTTLEAHFYPDKSWCSKARADDYILAHEQLHFDITELHVRKLRKQIAQVKVSQNLKSKLNLLHKTSNIELAAMQNKYDTETNNAIDKDFQKQWELFIKKELQNYEAYKSKD